MIDRGSGGSMLAIAAALLASAPAEAQTAGGAAPAAPPAAKPAPGKEIVVTGARSDVVASADRVSFSVANDLQAQTGTVADALRSVPGVEVDLQGNVSLRGDTGVTILIDGRPSALMRGEGRGDVLLSMPAGRIERVEVMSGGSAALSPEGSGGIINLVTKKVKADSRSATVRGTVGGEGRRALGLSASHSGGKLTATADLNLRRFPGGGEGRLERERFDPDSGAFLDSVQETRIDNVPTARMGRVALDYDVDKWNRLSTELNLRRFAIDLDRTDDFTGEEAAQSYDRTSNIALRNRGGGARLSWRRTLPGKDHELVTEVEAERARLSRKVDGVTDFAGAPASFETISNQGRRGERKLRVDYKRPLGEADSLNLGYHLDLNRSEFDSTGERGASLDALLPVPGLTNSFDVDEAIHAWFGTYRFRRGKLETQLGLRLEHVGMDFDQITDDLRYEQDYLRAYPTLHMGYDLGKGRQLRGSFSRRIQRPSVQDLNPYTVYIDPLNVRRGNPFLKPEVTDALEISYQIRKGPAFYSLTGFYRRSKDGVTDIFTDLGDGVLLTSRANLATGQRVGVDAIVNGKLNKTVSYNMSGTFQWNEIDPKIGGFSQRRSGTTGSARTNLTWQPTPKDFFQLNAVLSGKQLLPQGYRRSGGILNLGYRRKIDDKLSLLLTAQDVLGTARQVSFFETATLRERSRQVGNGRLLLFGFSYTVGGDSAKRKDPGFEFQQPGADTPQ